MPRVTLVLARRVEKFQLEIEAFDSFFLRFLRCHCTALLLPLSFSAARQILEKCAPKLRVNAEGLPAYGGAPFNVDGATCGPTMVDAIIS